MRHIPAFWINNIQMKELKFQTHLQSVLEIECTQKSEKSD